MTVIGPNEEEVLAQVKRTYEDDTEDEPESSFYVERETSLIYEVRFFPEFALVRPAHPEYLSVLERMSLMEFANKFDEYYGDPQAIHDFMWGRGIHSIEITRKD